MTKDVLKTQSRLMELNLLRENDVLDVLVLSTLGDKVQVRSKGGILGTLSPEKQIAQGIVIEAKVARFEDGVPVFEPTEEWLFITQSQRATVSLIFPRGIGAETSSGKLIYYECNKLPEVLQGLNVGDEVLAYNLVKEAKNGCEMYKAIRLEPAPKESKPTSELEAWSSEQIEKAHKAGLSKQWQGVFLGKKCWVEVHNSRSASFKEVPISLEEGSYFPRGCKRAEVLITYISGEKVGANKEIRAKFVRKEDVFSEAPAKSIHYHFDDQTSVGYWDKKFAIEAEAQGSKRLAGIYQLGRNYKVEIGEDGKPTFLPSREKPLYPVNSVKISKVSSECDFEAFDIVSCRIDFIYNEGNGNYVFEVTVLKVL